MRTAGHGGKTSRAQQRCGRLWAETEAKTNPAGPREATGPQGQVHWLHLGPRALLQLGFFHGYQILGFVLMDCITSWCVWLCVENITRGRYGAKHACLLFNRSVEWREADNSQRYLFSKHTPNRVWRQRSHTDTVMFLMGSVCTYRYCLKNILRFGLLDFTWH